MAIPGESRIPEELRSEWRTPQYVFDYLDGIFAFTLDAAATADNAKCERFLTKKEDALRGNWGRNERVFINPPYGKKGINKNWVSLCVEEAYYRNSVVVGLLPASVGTRWYHDFVRPWASVYHVVGRIEYESPLKIEEYDISPESLKGPSYESMIVVWTPSCSAIGGVGYIEFKKPFQKGASPPTNRVMMEEALR